MRGCAFHSKPMELVKVLSFLGSSFFLCVDLLKADILFLFICWPLQVNYFLCVDFKFDKLSLGCFPSASISKLYTPHFSFTCILYAKLVES